MFKTTVVVTDMFSPNLPAETYSKEADTLDAAKQAERELVLKAVELGTLDDTTIDVATIIEDENGDYVDSDQYQMVVKAVRTGNPSSYSDGIDVFALDLDKTSLEVLA